MKLPRGDHAEVTPIPPQPENKLYFLFYTCAVVGAIHFELVELLTVSDCLFAIRRLRAHGGTVMRFILIMLKHFEKHPSLCRNSL